MKGWIWEYTLKAKRSHRYDLQVFLANNKNTLFQLLQKILQLLKNIKFQIALNVKLATQSMAEDGGRVSIQPWFLSNAQACYAEGIHAKLHRAMKQIVEHIDTFIPEGSGWMLEKVLSLRLKVVRFKPFAGGCKSTKLPGAIAGKQACISFECENNLCFAYSVLAGMCPQAKPPTHVLLRCWVVKSGRPILSNDYEANPTLRSAECRLR